MNNKPSEKSQVEEIKSAEELKVQIKPKKKKKRKTKKEDEGLDQSQISKVNRFSHGVVNIHIKPAQKVNHQKVMREHKF